MTFAISNLAWTELEDVSMYPAVAKHAYALEVAPGRIVSTDPYGHIEMARTWKETIANNLPIVSMQSLFFGYTGLALFESESMRQASLDVLKCAVDFAASLACPHVVFGSPKNRISHAEGDWQTALAFFATLAEHAKACHVRVGIEANPSVYGCNFLTRTEDTLRFVKELNHSAIRLQVDTGTMLMNHESPSILQGQMEWISHVHLSEPYLAPLSSMDFFREVLSVLSQEAYNQAVSIEMLPDPNQPAQAPLHAITSIRALLP